MNWRYIHSVKRQPAIESSAFTAEIVPVNVVTRRKPSSSVKTNSRKANSTAEALGALRPAFDKSRNSHRWERVWY
ncbi:hypothetical protein ACP0HM_11180 [Escherichia coli]